MAELPPGAARWIARRYRRAPAKFVLAVVGIAVVAFWLMPYFVGISLIIGIVLLGRAMENKGSLTNGARAIGSLVILAVVGAISAYTIDALAPFFGTEDTSSAVVTELDSGRPPSDPSRSSEAVEDTSPEDAEPTTTLTTSSPPGGTAALLASLEVKGRSGRTGYDRAAFGQVWLDVDRNGCDTRNDILRRDLDEVILKPDSNGCAVLSGILDDPYTGRLLDFTRGVNTSRRVHVDHVVALSDAWQKGAFGWPARRLAAFANDPLELLAVDGSSNMSKSDGDAATWLPAKPFRCKYVALQVAVKAKYKLWVTRAEGAAMARVLEVCPDEPVPVSEPIVLGR